MRKGYFQSKTTWKLYSRNKYAKTGERERERKSKEATSLVANKNVFIKVKTSSNIEFDKVDRAVEPKILGPLFTAQKIKK